MAKRKKRKNKEKNGFKYPIEIRGILFILFGVIGFLGYKANILGTVFKGFAMFLMGTFDFVALTLFIVIGLYMVIKRERPNYLTSRLFGFYILLLSLLALAHLNYLAEDPSISSTVKETLDEFLKCINAQSAFNGGGMIGALIISALYVLLGRLGSIIVISVLMVLGSILMLDFSIGEFISNIHQKFVDWTEADDEEDDENDVLDDKDLIVIQKI